MANGHGGSRVPSNPAPVSGPGALSKRTDGQGVKYMSGGQYGEGQEMVELQSSAPMSKTQSGSAQPRMRQQPGGSAAMQQNVTALFAPTERPDEPITAGAPFGPGPGPAQPGPTSLANRKPAVVKYLPYLEEATRWPDAPESFKAFVRYLQGVQ